MREGYPGCRFAHPGYEASHFAGAGDEPDAVLRGIERIEHAHVTVPTDAEDIRNVVGNQISAISSAPFIRGIWRPPREIAPHTTFEKDVGASLKPALARQTPLGQRLSRLAFVAPGRV
jgi:hypothetical protein